MSHAEKQKELIQEWLNEEGDYDERVWPEIEKFLNIGIHV